MRKLRHIYALVILAALTAGLTIASSVQAKPTARTVTDVFAVTYDAKVTFKHHKAHSEFMEENDARYQIHGRLPEVTFVDGLLQTDQSAVVKTTAKGFAGVEVKQTDGWSLNCVATVFKIRGLVGLARTENGVSFLPALSAEPKGRCVDSEGVRPPFPFSLPWPGAGGAGFDDKKAGATTFPVSAKSIDVPSWSKPFRVVFEDEKCPNYEAELSVLCTFVMQGKLTLTRVDREEQVNGEVLLPSLDPPKLSPKKNKVTTTIECQSGCDVEALIGVFSGTAKNPKVTPLHKTKLHLPADKPTTISLPVTAADLAAAKQGVLVMTLQAEGGKQQVYPLAAPAPFARAASTVLTGRGAVRDLVLPARASVRAGAVTMLVSNPNGFAAKGSLELRLGKKRLGQTALAVPPHGGRKLTVKLGSAAQATLTRQGAQRLTAVASFRDPGGRLRRTTGTVALPEGSAGGPPAPNAPQAPPPPPVEETGPVTYSGINGLTVVITEGKLVAFNGQISTYCTKTARQKTVSFGMYGDDPDPTVGADGSFAYEATTGYGFVKLKYEGRVSGDTATGTLVVEDRSPISTSDGRLDFDYCYAGAEWSATR